MGALIDRFLENRTGGYTRPSGEKITPTKNLAANQVNSGFGGIKSGTETSTMISPALPASSIPKIDNGRQYSRTVPVNQPYYGGTPGENGPIAVDYGRGITEIIGGPNQTGRSFTNLIPAGAPVDDINKLVSKFQGDRQGVRGELQRWEDEPSGALNGFLQRNKPQSYAEEVGSLLPIGADGKPIIPNTLAGFSALDNVLKHKLAYENMQYKRNQKNQDSSIERDFKQAQIQKALAETDATKKNTENIPNKQELQKQLKIMDLRKKLLELPDGEEKMQAEKMIQMLENDIPFEYGIVEPEQEAKSYWRPEFLGGQPDTKARPAKYGYIAKGPAIPTTIK